jgi:hypothetical protein
MSLPRREFGLLLGAVVLAVSSTRPLAAQITWNARLGATYTTTMVTDQIAGSAVELRPTIAPTIAGEVAMPLHARTPLEGTAELQLTTATLESHQSSGTTRVAGMRTIALSGGIRGHFVERIKWRAGIGVISYATSEKAGVFQAGRPLKPMGTAALEYDRPLTATLHLSGVLRYDVHGFSTKQLEMNGYTGSQTVHRVTLSVGVSR